MVMGDAGMVTAAATQQILCVEDKSSTAGQQSSFA